MKHIFGLKPLLSRNDPKNEEISVVLGNSYHFLWIDIAVRVVVFLIVIWRPEFVWALLILNFSFLLVTTYYLKRRFKGILKYLNSRLIAFPDFRESLESKKKLFIYPEKSINKIKYSLFYALIFVLLSCCPIIICVKQLVILKIVIVFLAALISFFFAWRYSAIFLERDLHSVYFRGKKVTNQKLEEIKDYLNKEDFVNDSSLNFRNDKFILDLDKDFNIYKEKLETFLLESVFLGALTFTTFIQIIDGKDWQEYMNSFESFFQHVWNTKMWDHGKLKETLGFGFLLVGSVVSSIMYMVILMKRFPIIKSIENVKGHLKMAQFYNEKEENESSEKSKIVYTQQIQVEIAKCEEQKIMLDSNFRIVSFFRASGLFSFFMVLLVATMMISWVFFLSALLVVLYVVVAAKMIDDDTIWSRFIMSKKKQKENKTISVVKEDSNNYL